VLVLFACVDSDLLGAHHADVFIRGTLSLPDGSHPRDLNPVSTIAIRIESGAICLEPRGPLAYS
jgi:hypothetical protein